MIKIKKIGVIGAGTMGAAIAQKFAQEGFTVYLNDREQKYIDKGIAGIREILEQGLERKLFTPDKVAVTIANINGTTNLEDLKVCDLIVEAIFEDFEIKSKLFKELSKLVSKETILASNTSSFSITKLAESVSHPERFIGLHYFFHAAKNRLVEIIPGDKTSDETYKTIKVFSVQSGKDAITTKDINGFAVNRFFVPWLNEACKMLDEGVGTIPEIDTICMKTFGIGMGPFALMNATGVPIALHAQKTLEHFGTSYKVSTLLEKQVLSGNNWNLSGMENVVLTTELTKSINDRILGSTFFVSSQILAEKVCSAVDLNRGAKIGLRWRKGPIDLMKHVGEKEVKRIVSDYVKLYGEKMPVGIKSVNWKMEFVTIESNRNRAVITMSRPENMNALNEDVMAQLDHKFSQADTRDDIDTIILTGSGKAFVAGADIKFFVNNIKSNSIENIVSFTKYGQKVFEKIDRSSKKVIAILNGLALGGGMELALCADILLAVPKTKISFPETSIGIYPGLGGTQRSALRVGKGLAKYLVLTGQQLSSDQALEIGLIDGIVDPLDVPDLISGKKDIPQKSKIELPKHWKAIASLFSKNNYKSIIAGDYTNGEIEAEIVIKLVKSMRYKAPIAMDFAQELIEKAQGPASELEKLKDIFTTEDAFLGLTSIGKKVVYSGK
jgi:enoyl-CoA hydratase/3-hydroxyacyl-CoA dehydrogenase